MKSGEKKAPAEKPKRKEFQKTKDAFEKPKFQKKEEPKAVEGDMQNKLKALMGKFK